MPEYKGFISPPQDTHTKQCIWQPKDTPNPGWYAEGCTSSTGFVCERPKRKFLSKS